MTQVFSNNAISTLSSGITAISLTLTVSTGDGALFESPTAPDFELITLVGANGTEIVKVTSRASDTLTVVRAQEGTSALVFTTGERVEARLTAGTLDSLASGGFDPDVTEIEIGTGAAVNASATNSLAIGATTTVLASGTDSVALGVNAYVAQTNSVAIGSASYTNDPDTIAIGKSAQTYGTYSISIGTLANAKVGGSVAIGYSTYARYVGTIAIGDNAHAEGNTGSIAIGDGATVGTAAISGIAIGNASVCNDIGGTAIGHNSYARFDYTLAVGYDCESHGNYGISIGYQNYTNGVDSICIGKTSDTNGSPSITIGDTSSCDGDNAISLGADTDCNIDNVHVLSGTSMVRAGVDSIASTAIWKSAGQENYIFSQLIDLKTAVDDVFSLTIPTGASFFPIEAGVIVTDSNTVTVQPQVSFGVTGNTTALLAATATTKTAIKGKDKFTTLITEDGQTSITGSVKVAATATTLTGRMYVKGIMIEDD